MLKTKLDKTFTQLNNTEKLEMYKAIVCYSLAFTDARNLRETAKEFGQASEVLSLKKSFLDQHNYMLSRFWRGVWWYAKTNNIKEAAKKYEVSLDDLQLAKTVLPSEHYEALSEVQNKDFENFLTEKQKLELLKEVIPYINNMVRRKLEFISKFDSASSASDLASDLIVEAIRVMSIYDFLGDRLKLLNYIRRAVHNRAINIIKDKTTLSKQRIKRTEENKEETILIKNDLRRMGHADLADRVSQRLDQFQSTTLSFDKPISSEDDSFNLSNLVPDKTPLFNVECEINDFVNKCEDVLSQDEVCFIKIVLGEYNRDFEAWIYQNYECDSQDLHINVLIKNALIYTAVDQKKIQRKLEFNNLLSSCK